MPREIHFYECATCEEQYSTWSQAEACEWDHQYAKEQTA